MKIRAITVFCPCNNWIEVKSSVRTAATAAKALAASFKAVGYEVQTTRIAMNSFEEWVSQGDAVANILELASLLEELDVHFFNLGPATTAEGRALLLPLLHSSPRLSASCACTHPVSMRVDEDAIADAAKVTASLGRETEGGFGNFRFCATFCTPPHIAFFPAACAPSVKTQGEESGKGLCFTLGLECGDVAVSALEKAQQQQASSATDAGNPKLPISVVSKSLSEAFTAVAVPLEASAHGIVQQLCESEPPAPVWYGGLDASLNPGLDSSYSVGAAFEIALGGKPFGSSGTLAVASAFTEALKSLPVKLCGYSGLMLPPLEDTTLALRQAVNQEDTGRPSYGITELLAYSSVCGVGLDTVPIPGDTSEEEIRSVLLDTAALSTKWKKPLSCRLFPVPGLAAGDMTTFDSPYLVNTRVFRVP